MEYQDPDDTNLHDFTAGPPHLEWWERKQDDSDSETNMEALISTIPRQEWSNLPPRYWKPWAIEVDEDYQIWVFELAQLIRNSLINRYKH